MENKEKVRFAYKTDKGITDEEVLDMIRMVNENSCNWELRANDEPSEIKFIDFDDMPTKYSGVIGLASCTMWEDVVKVLLGNGYEVTARLEDAKETEREFDKAEKRIVIEFEKVER